MRQITEHEEKQEQIKRSELREKLKDKNVKLCNKCSGNSVVWPIWMGEDSIGAWGLPADRCYECKNKGYIEIKGV